MAEFKLGSGFVRKGIIDSTVIRRNEPLVSSCTNMLWWRSHEGPEDYSFEVDACGLGTIRVKCSIKPSISDHCISMFGKSPVLDIRIKPAGERNQTNFEAYLTGLTTDEFILLRLSIE